MTMKTQLSFALALLFAAYHAQAATTFAPSTPTQQDVITANIEVPSSTIYGSRSTSVSGNVIRTNLTVLGFDTNGISFPTHLLVGFGPLPAGTYTYQVYDVFQGQPFLISETTLVVAPPIPIMNGFYFSMLALFLAAIACSAIGKLA